MSIMPPMPCIQRFPEVHTDRETLLPGLAAYALQRTELPRGVRLRFTATAERLRQIEAVARRERAYCAALEFRVGMSLGAASLTLDVTGPAGTETFLAELLDAPMAA
jgi:hypothetical protein